MSSKRRYQPIGKYPVYSKEFDRLRMASVILNPDPRPSINMIFWNKDTLKSELIKTLGNFKPLAQEKLNNIEIKFQDLQTDCRNQGKKISVEMPESLQNEKYKVEASIDVLTEEAEFLTEKLKTISDRVEKIDESLILRMGLQCSGNFHGIGTNGYQPDVAPAMLDGQHLEMLPKEKILIISEKTSPYFGMAVSDYRSLSKQWHQDRINADENLLKTMQAEAKENGLPKPYSTGQSFNRTVSRSDLPKFPTWATNWKAKKEVEEEQPEKRMKKYSNSKIK